MEQTIDASNPAELMKAVAENKNAKIVVDENAPKKRKKYSARQGVVCPDCGANMRSLFATLNEGGLRLIPMYNVCMTCMKVFRIRMDDVTVIEVKPDA